MFLSSLTLCNISSVGETDLLHPFAETHFETFKILLIYFPKCASLSMIRSCAPNAIFQSTPNVLNDAI